ncbi:hypothetical protein [Paraburkholderia caribensis]|uniref:hypothetical protein n=1 Tax=Paraburkholderia caribensis TaxID=75105 RepID=UPI000A89B08E|nr:hypothetical protein [Paraburkholderia caribensis]
MDHGKTESKEDSFRDFGMAVGGFALGCVLAAAFAHVPGDSPTWASWAQAFGTVAAIAGAFVVAAHDTRAQRSARDEEAKQEAATTILSLQVLANELARMCTLSMYQKQDRSGQIIYADAAGEFDAIARIFHDFPIGTVAAQGQMHVLLHLRRIALEMSSILRSDPDLGGEQFVLRHRTRNLELTSAARRHSIELAEVVRRIAPGRFDEQIATRL